jgi:hypothetical protein
MDKELRDALHSFVAAMAGEEQIERMMKEEEESVDAWNDAHRLHAGEKTREEVLDFLVSVMRSLEPWFKAFHAEHGCYPEPPDFSKLPWIGRLEDLEEEKTEETNHRDTGAADDR